jgi:hypothetical protein
MNRLQSELNRLYLTGSADTPSPHPIDAQGRVRAMVMELTQPADWDVLSRVWHGVQSELELPAPGIAVSGTDGLQLWFSLAEPITPPQAQAFLEALRARFLPDIGSTRVRLMPAASSGPHGTLHAPLVPALQALTGNWSAFVAADLAGVFAESPWLDMAPNDEGQANLLRGLETMKQTSFDAASKRLAAPTVRPSAGASEPTAATPERSGAATPDADPKRFLIKIMNDETVALALRIEAAKALLPYAD